MAEMQFQVYGDQRDRQKCEILVIDEIIEKYDISAKELRRLESLKVNERHGDGKIVYIRLEDRIPVYRLFVWISLSTLYGGCAFAYAKDAEQAITLIANKAYGETPKGIDASIDKDSLINDLSCNEPQVYDTPFGMTQVSSY